MLIPKKTFNVLSSCCTFDFALWRPAVHQLVTILKVKVSRHIIFASCSTSSSYPRVEGTRQLSSPWLELGSSCISSSCVPPAPPSPSSNSCSSCAFGIALSFCGRREDRGSFLLCFFSFHNATALLITAADFRASLSSGNF